MNSNLQRRANLFLGLLLVGCGVLYSFPPQEYHFYPVCPFYALTHLLCPGCGGTRALYQLLHGNFGEALRLNALVTMCAPVFLAWFFYWYLSAVRGQRPAQIRWHWGFTAVGIALALVFAVIRNTGIAFTI